MKKETIVYTDYNGVERKEDFFFNFTKAELLEMELGTTGGLSEMIQKIIDTHDTPAIIKIFKEIVLKAYGQKSPDGKRFIKTPELTTEFMQTEAYSTLFMELATNTDKAADFINKIVPQDMAQKATPSASVPANN
jgi:hypothetical protein